MARRPSDYDQIESSVLNRIAGQNVSISINDIAAVIGDALKTQRREIIEHVGRMFKLAELKSSAGHDPDDTRMRNLHRRVTQLESEMRRLTRSRSP